jgi:hypothetical protein
MRQAEQSLRRDRSATMTVPLLTLMVQIVAFGVEVGWLMAEPPVLA